jgi:hypothetical protein
MKISLPAIEQFVLCHLSAPPVAGAVGALTATQRTALAGQVGSALRSYADGDGVAVPDETNIAMAYA